MKTGNIIKYFLVSLFLGQAAVAHVHTLHTTKNQEVIIAKNEKKNGIEPIKENGTRKNTGCNWGDPHNC